MELPCFHPPHTHTSVLGVCVNIDFLLTVFLTEDNFLIFFSFNFWEIGENYFRKENPKLSKICGINSLSTEWLWEGEPVCFLGYLGGEGGITCALALVSPQQLLECNKCRNSYHPECLGPNYPTKPTKKKKVWVGTHTVLLPQASWWLGEAGGL